MSRSELQTGDPCPKCGNALHAIVFYLSCGDCGWSDRDPNKGDYQDD